MDKEDDKKVRLDKYVWAMRRLKTRTQASAANDAGKVKMHGDNVKAARIVGIGAAYEVKPDARHWVIEVTAILEVRVQYSEAIKHYIDKTPPELIEAQKSVFSFNTGKRMSKSGRPTIKDRRSLDEFI